MFKDIKENMNKCILKRAWTYKQLDEMMKTFSDTKTERESLKKTQVEIKLEMKNLKCQTKTSEVSIVNRL